MFFYEEINSVEAEHMDLPEECLFDSDLKNNRKTPTIAGVKPELYLEELFQILGV